MVERQNRHIAKQFTEIVHKIESLYRNDAARQVETAQRNVLADYGELLDVPSVCNLIFAVADALIGGQPVSVSSGGGGPTSDLPWDGRRLDEEEEAYRKRCLMFAIGMVKKQNEKKSYRRK